MASPRYYATSGTEAGLKPRSRFPSLAQPGTYVSRREHQKEIGKPLPDTWRHSTATSKAGERQVWTKGTMGQPVTLKQFGSKLGRLMPRIENRAVPQILVSIQWRDASGQDQWWTSIMDGPQLQAEVRDLQQTGGSLIDIIRNHSETAQGFTYNPQATGGVQFMILPEGYPRQAA